VPEEHDPSDLTGAMQLALDRKHYYGIFYEESGRPTFEDNELTTREKAAG